MKKLMIAFMLLLALSFAGISISNYSVSKSTFQPNEAGVLTATTATSANCGYRKTSSTNRAA